MFKGLHLNPNVVITIVLLKWEKEFKITEFDLLRVGANKFICKFVKNEDQDTIWGRQPMQSLGSLILMQHFNREKEVEEVSFDTIPVTITFKGLLLEHLDPKVIIFMARRAGVVVAVEPNDSSPTTVEGFRARIIVNVHLPLVQGGSFNSTTKGKIYINFIYFDMPPCYCTKCHTYGHKRHFCSLRHEAHALQILEPLGNLIGTTSCGGDNIIGLLGPSLEVGQHLGGQVENDIDVRAFGILEYGPDLHQLKHLTVATITGLGLLDN
ncbi:hypothetical protein FRX31_016076 [Thalictrum thalictroides]|uniref:DUF4283 domain-containing protein n=1 Tax=Thalictrum thalictroides TaxID=46969 RepID=A0A7J6WA79_THATH|nr:hypothetical protein FRX31_016076 [Thalictrum thalictroides]